MSSDVSDSTDALHPLLRQALADARTHDRSVLVRLPMPRPVQDPWAFAHHALSSGARATIWSDPDQEVLAVGVGEALRLEGSGTERLLDLDAQFQAVHTHSHPLLEALPLWFGGFAFDHRRAMEGPWQHWPSAELVTHGITALQHQKKSYTVLSLVVHPHEEVASVHARYTTLKAQLRALHLPADAPSFSALDFTEQESQKHWAAQVHAAQEAIDQGTFAKIVLARRVSAAWPEDARGPDAIAAQISAALHALRRRYQHCTVFALARPHAAESTLFFGATPELLAERKDAILHTMALAGTAPRLSDVRADAEQQRALLASSKERQEHQFVVQDIAKNLASIGVDVRISSAPDVVTFPNVHHLKTPIRGTEPTTLGLLPIANALHPTPAICGTPTDTTYAWLHAHEGMARGWYAGGVMWLNDGGDGRVNVALRSAIANAHEVCAYAGAGIVEGSDAQQEWDETRAKLSPICDAFVPLEQ